jgi:aminopeptidase N
VILECALDDTGLARLLAHDNDPFNRWEASQQLAGRLILSACELSKRGEAVDWPDHANSLISALRHVMNDAHNSPDFIAEVLTLPGEATLAEQMTEVDPETLYLARSGLASCVAEQLENEFVQRYLALGSTTSYCFEPAEVARRRLRNTCLSYLNEIVDSSPTPRYRLLARRQFDEADNMTDRFAALVVLANAPGDEGERALTDFYRQWKDEALVVDKWLAVQAACRLPDTLQRVERLLDHAAFDLRNPNKVYALLLTYGANHRHFHTADGAGYRFLADRIAELDVINPQVASRLARCFDRWARFDADRRRHAGKALRGLQARDGLSRDVYEVVDKALASAPNED